MRNGTGPNAELTGDDVKPSPTMALRPGKRISVEVSAERMVHRFDDPFSAAVWLLEEFASAEQIQDLRGSLGRALLIQFHEIPVERLPDGN